MTVRTNTRITAPDWFQEVRHIELDSSDSLEWVALNVESWKLITV